MKFAAFFVMLFTSLSALGIDPEFRKGFERARENSRNSNSAAALNELLRLRERDPKLFELNNLDYLLARTAAQNGDHALASAEFQRVIERRSVLAEYAIWHMSQLFRNSGNKVMERIYLDQLSAMFPESILIHASANRLARSWMEDQNFQRAVAEFEVISSMGPTAAVATSSLGRENQALMANAYLGAGNVQKARELFQLLISNISNPAQPDDFALDAARGLDAIDGGSENIGKSVPELPEDEHMLRGGIYQFNRDFRQARLHYRAIVNRHANTAVLPDAIFQVGRGYVQTGEFAEAFRWFERLLEQYPDHQLAADALLQAASAYSRTGKHREAVSRYQRFIDQYPEHPSVDRAYLNIIDILRDQGSETEALQRSEETQKVFRGKAGEAQALFATSRLYIAREDWKSAKDALARLSPLPDLGGSRLPGGTNAAEVAFMLAHIHEKLQEYDSAIDRYLALTDGRDEYYGWRATLRLQALGQTEQAKPLIDNRIEAISSRLDDKEPKVRKGQLHALLRLTAADDERREILGQLADVYNDLPAYNDPPALAEFGGGRKALVERPDSRISANRHEQMGNELAFLGLYEEAAPELQRSGKPPASGELADAFARGNRVDRAVAISESEWRKVPADFQPELIPVESVRTLYPVPYRESLLRSTATRDVDPRFLLAIMRQESRFQPEVKSVAAARGLMQFISTTSSRTAGELGIDAFRQNDLYDPQVAILFGAQYSSNLFKMFPGQHPAVAASYNGGEDNMKRWMDRSRSMEPDRYVPEIGFAQSKDYVYKVMANYRVYTTFYDRELRPIDPLRPE